MTTRKKSLQQHCFKKWESPLRSLTFYLFMHTLDASSPLEAIFRHGKNWLAVENSDNDFVMHNNRFVFKVCEILVLTTLKWWKMKTRQILEPKQFINIEKLTLQFHGNFTGGTSDIAKVHSHFQAIHVMIRPIWLSSSVTKCQMKSRFLELQGILITSFNFLLLMVMVVKKIVHQRFLHNYMQHHIWLIYMVPGRTGKF